MHVKIYLNHEMHTKLKNITRQARINIQPVFMNSRATADQMLYPSRIKADKIRYNKGKNVTRIGLAGS